MSLNKYLNHLLVHLLVLPLLWLHTRSANFWYQIPHSELTKRHWPQHLWQSISYCELINQFTSLPVNLMAEFILRENQYLGALRWEEGEESAASILWGTSRKGVFWGHVWIRSLWNNPPMALLRIWSSLISHIQRLILILKKNAAVCKVHSKKKNAF